MTIKSCPTAGEDLLARDSQEGGEDRPFINASFAMISTDSDFRGTDQVARVTENIARSYTFVNAMKGLAACLIVWHHMSLYSPNVELAYESMPALMQFLNWEARYCVSLFFVVGGFLLSISMSSSSLNWCTALRLFGRRYFRLVVPYAVMLSVLLAVAWSCHSLQIQPPLIDSFSWLQLAAHLLFLQDILGLGNFSAGTWYLCIELQFAGLIILLHWLAAIAVHGLSLRVSSTSLVVGALIPLGIASNWNWSRDPEQEMFVTYFLGLPVLGFLIGMNAKDKVSLSLVICYAAFLASSLLIDFRPRVLVALFTAACLWIGVRYSGTWHIPKWLNSLGEISYCLFLIHYLVNWMVLSSLSEWTRDSPIWLFGSFVLAFGASLSVARLMHRWVEKPTNQWLRSRFVK